MSAIISECGLYRYTLTRELRSGTRLCTFIMLNPSTADAEKDDPTIRRCKGFASGFGCDALVVVNVFAFRATKPADLYKAADPVGPANDQFLADALRDAAASDGLVICAWGANETRGRDFRIKRLAEATGARLQCLETTKAGAPKHPLYIASNATLRGWS